MKLIRTFLAQRKLARIVEERADSFEIRQFAKNRAAQIKRRTKKEKPACPKM